MVHTFPGWYFNMTRRDKSERLSRAARLGFTVAVAVRRDWV